MHWPVLRQPACLRDVIATRLRVDVFARRSTVAVQARTAMCAVTTTTGETWMDVMQYHTFENTRNTERFEKWQGQFAIIGEIRGLGWHIAAWRT